MSTLSESDVQKAAESIADPALDNWVALQDVIAEVAPLLSTERWSCLDDQTWDKLHRGAFQVLNWMESHGLVRVGQYQEPLGLVYWPEQAEALESRFYLELQSAEDTQTFRMDTMLGLTRAGVEWAKKITGRSSKKEYLAAEMNPAE